MDFITDLTFAEFVRTGTRVVLISAAASFASLRTMLMMQTVAKKLDPSVRLRFFDSTKYPAFAASLTNAIPSIHVFKDGKQTQQLLGAPPDLAAALAEAGVPFVGGAAPAVAAAASFVFGTAPARPHLPQVADFSARVRSIAQVDSVALRCAIEAWTTGCSSARRSGSMCVPRRHRSSSNSPRELNAFGAVCRPRSCRT
jgi:hypothetical protein